MIIILEVWSFFAVVHVAMMILKRMDDAWSRLPHFIHNREGEVWSICSITDFGKTAPEDLLDAFGNMKKFRCVSETVTFGPNPAAGSDGARYVYISGSVSQLEFEPWEGKGSVHPTEHSPALFIPFVSEQYGSIDDQKSFFIAPQNPTVFLESKRQENCRHDFRLRFAEWAIHWNTDAWERWSFRILITVTVLAIAGVFLLTMKRE